MPRNGHEWFQGHLLSHDQSVRLGLVECQEVHKKSVIISHDCDLRSDIETEIEFIVGEVVTVVNPMLVGARHPRQLQVRYPGVGGASLCVQLSHANHRKIAIADFEALEQPGGAIDLPRDEKRALKQWLAARYGRPAFPSAFESRLRKTVRKKRVDQHIAKILAPESEHLVGLFFDLGEERFVELENGLPYFLSIMIVYDALDGGHIARIAGEKVALQIKQIFEEAYGAPADATEICLDKCDAVADTNVSLAHLKRVDQWRVEYLSFAEDPPGDFLAIG